MEDPRSIDLKSSLVHRYHWAGTASWRRGLETQDIWLVLDLYLKQMADYAEWAEARFLSDSNFEGGGAVKLWIKWVMVTVILVAVMIPFINRGLSYYRFQRQMELLEIGSIDPLSLADGVYWGIEDVGLIRAEVEVHVTGGMIESIQLQHQHDRGARAEVIVRSVIESQSIAVDTISGATDSSKVILKAIEKALKE